MGVPATMRAMILNQPNQPLELKTVAIPSPSHNQVLIRLIACGVCRTDLHIVDGELTHPKLPLIPGHEIIGTVVKVGSDVTVHRVNDVVGVPWLAHTCGQCKYCLKDRENLCEQALFTGYSVDGGYAEYTVADEGYCYPIPLTYANAPGAPLLCAGLIGYRSYRLAGKNISNLGIYGFGAAAHILVQIANGEGKNVFAFTRPGDKEAQTFAMELGAKWAGDSLQTPPEPLDAAIIFAPAGDLVPKALMDIDKGGVVVCGGIHMSDIPGFPYKILWEERVLRSIANLTRTDGREFFQLISRIPVKTEIQTYKLEQANEALNDLRNGRIHGAAVLVFE